MKKIVSISKVILLKVIQLITKLVNFIRQLITEVVKFIRQPGEDPLGDQLNALFAIALFIGFITMSIH